MDPLTIHHDPEGQTLTVWFDDRSKEHVAEETGGGILLIKDEEGHVIGIERLNHILASGRRLQVEVIEGQAAGRGCRF